MSKLCEKAEISKENLSVLIEEYPGILAIEQKKKKSNDSDPHIELAPTARLQLCDDHISYSKKIKIIYFDETEVRLSLFDVFTECKKKNCTFLHLCPGFLKGHDCEQKKKRCKLGHSLDISHNERVLERELECKEVSHLSDEILDDLVSKLATWEDNLSEDSGTDNDQTQGTNDSATIDVNDHF